MTFEYAHLATIRNISVNIFVIFKDDIIEETLEVERLLSADNIESSILFLKRELLS